MTEEEIRNDERDAILRWIDSCYWSLSHQVWEVRQGIISGKYKDRTTITDKSEDTSEPR